MTTLFPLAASEMPLSSQIVRGARLSACKPVPLYRYTLTRQWRIGPRVLFSGVNPSTADHRLDDPTVKRWTHFAASWGFGGFVAVNPIPYRAADQGIAARWYDGRAAVDGAEDADLQNDLVLAQEAATADLIVVCHGNASWAQPAIDHAMTILSRFGKRALHCLGRTKDGHPIHPMARGQHRVPDDAKPIIWRDAA